MIPLLIILILLCIVIYYYPSSRASTIKKSNLYIGKSNIHGKGLFSKNLIHKDKIIIKNLFPHKPKDEVLEGLMSNDIFNKYISKYGKKINHCSKRYNSQVVSKDNKLFKIQSIKNINPDEEITVNYDNSNKEFPFINISNSNYVQC